MQDKEVLDYIKQAFDLKAQGCYKQAIEMLYKTLEVEIDNIEILYQLGDLYFQLHNYPRAEKYFEKVLLKNPSHIDSYRLLMEIYLRENSLDNAKTIAEKIYTLDGSSKNLASLIKILANLNAFDEIDKYMNTDTSDDIVKVEYAKVCSARGDFEKALEIISSISEDCDEAQIIKGKILFDKNEFEDSYKIFKRLERVTENDEVLNHLGLFAMDLQDYTSAIKYFSKASSLNKNNSLYLSNLANAYYLNGWIEEAVSSYKKAIGLEPENTDYRYSLAYVYYRQKQFEKSANEVNFILDLDSKHSQTLVLQALLKYEDKDFLVAQKILEANLKNTPDDTFTMSALAKVYAELYNFDKAENILKNLTAKFPENISYSLDFANVYIKEKKFNEALDIADKLIEKNENILDAYICGASAAMAKQDFKKVKTYAQGAISSDINCSAGYYYLALARFSENDVEEAVECMKRAIFYDINNPLYYAEMSKLYKESGDIKTAFEYIKDAESLDKENESYKNIYKELAILNRRG